MNKRKIYGDGVLLQFEDCKLTAPTNYNDYLVHLFGDYNQLPTKEKRGSQHSFIELDLDKLPISFITPSLIPKSSSSIVSFGRTTFPFKSIKSNLSFLFI